MVTFDTRLSLPHQISDGARILSGKNVTVLLKRAAEVRRPYPILSL
jgi:hypothetical protein